MGNATPRAQSASRAKAWRVASMAAVVTVTLLTLLNFVLHYWLVATNPRWDSLSDSLLYKVAAAPYNLSHGLLRIDTESLPDDSRTTLVVSAYVILVLVCAMPGAYLSWKGNEGSEAAVSAGLHIFLSSAAVLMIVALGALFHRQSPQYRPVDFDLFLLAYLFLAGGAQLIVTSIATTADLFLVWFWFSRIRPRPMSE